jgi:hypothetical protein
MGAYLWGVGLAVLAAVGVIAAAGVASDGGTSPRAFWADLRAGLRRVKDRSARDEVDEAEPVDVPFEQLFAEASQPDDGYLQLDELAEVIERTGERAGRLLPGRAGEREPHPHGAAPQPHTGRARAPRPHPVAARRSGHVPAAPPRGHDG